MVVHKTKQKKDEENKIIWTAWHKRSFNSVGIYSHVLQDDINGMKCEKSWTDKYLRKGLRRDICCFMPRFLSYA